MKKAIVIASLAPGAVIAMPVMAADQPAQPTKEQVQAAQDKMRADKKFIVSQNMILTDDEAKAFWPLYEQYQDSLQKINKKIAARIEEYAGIFNSNSMTDAAAMNLLNEQLSIESEELALKKATIPKLQKVLPGTKVARYMQIENKLRAILKYELADRIPLIGDKAQQPTGK